MANSVDTDQTCSDLGLHCLQDLCVSQLRTFSVVCSGQKYGSPRVTDFTGTSNVAIEMVLSFMS